MRIIHVPTAACLAGILFTSLLVGPTMADPITVTYREGVGGYAMAGTGIRNGTSSLINWGINTHDVVGWTSGGTTLRGIYAWSLPGIPTNATIASVTITYNKSADATSINANANLYLHTLTAAFSEGNKAGGEPDAGGIAANWANRIEGGATDTPWTTQGGDFTAGILAQTAANPTVANVTFSFTGSGASNPLVQAVQTAVTNQNDFRYLMKTDELLDGSRVVFQVRSDNYGINDAERALRPQLSITYDIIPEPASLALLGLGGLLMLPRRSRA